MTAPRRARAAAGAGAGVLLLGWLAASLGAPGEGGPDEALHARSSDSPARAETPHAALAASPDVTRAGGTSAARRGGRDAFALDGGTPADLGLVPAPPDSEPGVEVPPEVRLSEARRAAETFSARLARLERERAQARAGGVADTAELDRVIEVVRRRLQIAELAERAILAEMGAQH